MRLRNSGAIQAAPVLEGAANKVVAELGAWPGLQAVTHWERCDSTAVDGAEFHVDDRELGHVHLDGSVHLLLSERLGAALVKRKLAHRLPWGAEWVGAPIGTAQEAEHALWLFRLGYDRLRAVDEAELLERVAGR